MSTLPCAPLLKKLVASVVPHPLIFALKKRYYPRVIQSFWEADVEPIKYLMKSGDVVIDIGANIGWYTDIFSKLVGNSGKVYTIEPIMDTFTILSIVSRKRKWKNVQLLNYAISEQDGSAFMEVPLHDYGGQNFYQSRIIATGKNKSNLRQYKVNLRSLDSLFRDSTETISFIKCDVEGHDLSVIKGASGVLVKLKPAWLIEVSGNPDDEKSPARELFKRMEDHNYTAYWYDGKELKRRAYGDYSVNYFFLQPSHLPPLTPLLQRL